MHDEPMESWECFLYVCVLVSCANKVVAQCGGSELRTNVSDIYKVYTLQYPDSGTYSENLVCSWIFHSFSYKQLHYLSVTSLANGDMLEIYDGTSTSGTLLYSSSSIGVSGQSLSVIASSGNSYFRFTSNGVSASNQLGFTVRYMTATSDDKGGCSSPAAITATDTKQYLTSPNFPNQYPMDSSCSWNFETESSCGSLVLDFILLDIENVCSADKVTVTYDGNPSIELCPFNDWDSSSDFTTTGSSAVVTLTSDFSDQYHGFVMSYIRTGCMMTTVTTTVSTTTSYSNIPTTTSTTTSGPSISTSSNTESTQFVTTETANTGTTTTTKSGNDDENTNPSLSSEGIGLIVAGVVLLLIAVFITAGFVLYRKKKKATSICSSKNSIG
ncbi:uncharacterized protein [Argopecten irradians]|uniref:uncharacterized protein n=1 Tax=Argopecten irradians TaxID=31199 RepID=UPI00371A47A4